MKGPRRITIVGGGLAGPLLACLLADQGREVTVVERRGDPRADGYEGGRSINLALSARGIQALQRIGLAEAVLDTVVPMQGRMMHDPEGRTSFSPYSVIPGEAINSVSRGLLNCMLLDAAESRPGVTLHFDVECDQLDVEHASLRMTHADGAVQQLEADLLVGADGAGSIVRQAMHRAEPTDDGTEFIDSGYKELTIPAGPDGSFLLRKDALHIWPRGHFMLIALPNEDGSFTCTCFWPHEGPESFAAVQSPDEIRSFFDTHFRDAAALMPDLVDEYGRNPVGPLGTVHCRRYHHGATTVLIGDAAHAIVPFFGQGMNASFLDCLRLAECIDRHDSPGDALADYDSTQRPDGAAIAHLSLRNFIEMRDHTASPLFRLLQRCRKRLNRMAPRLYAPLYNMVSFTTIPYTRVVAIDRRRRWGLRLGLLAIVLLPVLYVVLLSN